MIDLNSMVIQQAALAPRDRRTAAADLAGFIEEMKRSGFVASTLRASGVDDVTIAPPAHDVPMTS